MRERIEKGNELGKGCFFLLLCLWLVLIWTVGMAFPSAAYAGEAILPEDGRRVYDYGGLFSDEEVDELEGQAAALEERAAAAVLVLTVEDGQGRSARETADSFYFDHGFEELYREDGLVFLIDMDNREIYLGTYGGMIQVLTDQRIQDILDEAYTCVSLGEYAGAARAALDRAGYWWEKGIPSGQYVYQEDTGKIIPHRSIRWYEALFALAVSGGIAGSVCLGVVRQYKMEDQDGVSNAMAYQSSLNFRAAPSQDRLIHTAVTHTVIPRQPPRGGGAGGMGRMGGSGRSTTHSHGGHRAGGGGRKF